MSGIPADIWAAAQSVFSEGLWADEGDEREAVTTIARAIFAERERSAKLVEDAPAEVLVMWERPGGPPGNGYRVTTKADIAAAIRKGDHIT